MSDGNWVDLDPSIYVEPLAASPSISVLREADDAERAELERLDLERKTRRPFGFASWPTTDLAAVRRDG